MINSDIKTLLRVISDAGFRVTLDKHTTNLTIITAVDQSGETYQVRADSDMDAVIELAHMLHFEDMD